MNTNLKINLEAISLTAVLIALFLNLKNTEHGFLVALILLVAPSLWVAIRIDIEQRKLKN